jgi:hypothetical protein
MQALLNAKKAQLVNVLGSLEANNPELKSKKGFAQISRKGKVVGVEALRVGEQFEAMDAFCKVSAEVVTTEPIGKGEKG